jgi:hypothetical protein
MKKRQRKYLLHLYTIGIKSHGINLCLQFSPVSAKSLEPHFDKKLCYLVHLKLCQLWEEETIKKYKDTKIIL